MTNETISSPAFPDLGLSDDEDESKAVGPALPNTLNTTLMLFPLAERKPATKRKREENNNSPPITDLLFPTEEDLLGDSFDRMHIPHKKRKTVNFALQKLVGKLTPVVDEKPKKFKTKLMTPVQIVIGKPIAIKSEEKQEEKVREYSYMIPNEFNVRLVTPYVMYDYQMKAVQWMIDREEGKNRLECWRNDQNGGLLGLAMGLGKTPTSACLIARSLNLQRMNRSCSLYICPKNLLGTVRYEFEKFFGSQMKIIIYHRDFLRSEFDSFDETDIRKYDVIITNYSTIVTRMGFMKPGKSNKGAVSFCTFPWYRIILDESHEIREKNTQKHKSVMGLISPRRFCLTGTPICNKLSDIFHQLEFTGFKMPESTRVSKGVMETLNLMQMIHFVEQKDAESVKLPPMTEHKLFFDLSTEERFLHNFYTKNAQNIYKLLETQIGREKTKKALEVNHSCFRLMQICSAPYLITPAAKETDVEDMADIGSTTVFPSDYKINTWIQERNGGAGLKSSKMQRFVKLIESLQAQATPGNPLKMIIFANYTSTLRLAIAAMKEKQGDFDAKHVFVHGGIASSYKREELLTKFRISNQVECLFMTTKLGNVGLNLSEANRVVFLESWFSYSTLSQGIARCHRIGQVRPVDVYYLLAKDSIEERVLNIAMGKKKLSEDIMAQSEEKMDASIVKSMLFDMDTS